MKFKLQCFVITMLVVSFYPDLITSQNLVPNYSFENPVDFDLIESPEWHRVQNNDTPDYFNLDSRNPSNNIFDKYTGGTQAKSGSGFVGLFFYRTHPERKIKNVREYIQSGLKQLLEKDSIYRIEFSLCLDAESNIAVKNIGITFNTENLSNLNEYQLFKMIPQVEFSLASPDCRNNWITFSSFYKASGNEKYLILGNFKDDRNTSVQRLKVLTDKSRREKWDLQTSEKAAYYYIDDIIIEKAAINKSVDSLILVERNEQMVNPDTFDLNLIPVDSSIVLRNIFFDFDKSELLPASNKELEKLYRLLAQNNSLRIKIEGHTDNYGGYDYNLALSGRRAEAVVIYLMSRGISPNRMESSGFSYAVPIASNDTPEGRQLNRRVAFKIIAK